MASPRSVANAIQKLPPKSKLIIVEKAGHTETGPLISETLVKAAAQFQ